MSHQPETSNSSQNSSQNSTEISPETATTTAQPHVHGPGCNHGHHHGHQHEMTPFVRSTPKVGANDPCPCGSGKKHKKCCRQ